jgi:hypothetical protein
MDESLTGFMSPYIPGLKPSLSAWLMALVMKSLLPQITGLESPSPGISVFHLILVILSTSKVAGRFALSITPDEKLPRKAVHCLSGLTWPSISGDNNWKTTIKMGKKYFFMK